MAVPAHAAEHSCCRARRRGAIEQWLTSHPVAETVHDAQDLPALSPGNTLMTDTATPEDRLARLGIELPRVPVPIANFQPFRRHGDMFYLAGQTCEWNGTMVYSGKLGRDFDVETGQRAARICGLNLIAALRLALGGSLDNVSACIRLGGFVNADPEFAFVPKVVNGASDLMAEVFGPEIGPHARTAVGVATLPQNAAVEVDAIFAVR